MTAQTAEGFGQSVLELRRNLALIYPEQARPIGVAAVCLGMEREKRSHWQSGEDVCDRDGARYHTSGYTVKEPDALYRTVHVVAEDGVSINVQRIGVSPFESTREDLSKYLAREHHSKLRRTEAPILPKVISAFALLADYAQTVGVPFEAESTFDLDKTPVARRTWMLPTCWPIKDGTPQGLEGFTPPAR